MDLVRLRNNGGDREVAFLQGRVVEHGAVVEVAGRLADEQPVDDAWLLLHPTGDPDNPGRLMSWDKATWDLELPAKPAKGKE
jgi:hypothetical protein